MRLSVVILAFAMATSTTGEKCIAYAQTQPGTLLGTHIGDYDALAKKRLIRILVPFSKTIYFIDKGAEYGTAVDFGRALEKRLNLDRKRYVEHVRIAFIPTARDELIPALNAGRGDVIMANLTVTPARQGLVDFTVPIYSDAQEVLVAGPHAPAISSLTDLAAQGISVRKSSSYHEHLMALNSQNRENGQPEIPVHLMDESLEDEDLLEMINAELLAYTIVDRHTAEIWTTVFPGLKIHPDIQLASGGQIAWAIRKDSPLLKEKLDDFIKEHRVGTTFGNILKKKFFQSDKMIRQAYSPSDAEQFQRLVEIFKRYGTQYSFNYLMLAAQGYQESQLDQTRRSHRGAVGIMQLMPSTAADKAVAISGIDKSAERNIEAGAKYLRHLIDVYIEDGKLPEKETLLFALAAYNAGPGNLRKFRRKALEMNLDENLWFGNVEHAAAAIVGRETVQYVGNIYKYYVAYSLLTAQNTSLATDHDKAN